MTIDQMGVAVRSFALTTLVPFPVPVGADLPAPLAAALSAYERVRSAHAKARAHLSGHYERSLEARARDVEAVRSGKEPRFERAVEQDKAKRMLTIEGLQAEAREAEGNVRKVAAECADDYRDQLDRRAEQARDAVVGLVEAIRDRLIELRGVAVCQTWLDQVTTPGVPVKRMAVDTSGLDELLAPIVAALAGPGQQRDINDYLREQREGSSGMAFTIPVPSQSIRSSR